MTQEGPGMVPEARDTAQLLSRGRLTVMVVAFTVELGLFIAGLLLPLGPVVQGNLLNQTSSEFSAIQSAPPFQVVFLIFSHNIVIALVEVVPVVGAFIFASSIFATGVLAQALLASNGVPGVFGALLLLFPYSLVELSAYAVALGSGVMLIVAWGKKRLRSESRVLLEEIAVVVSLLLLAAAMEEATTLSPALGIALWIPTGLAVAALAFVAKRRAK